MIAFAYFDVGGVVVKDFTDTRKWWEMQKDLGVNHTNRAGFEALWSRYKEKICIDVDIDDLINIINNELQLKIKPSYSFLNDMVSRFKTNPSIWPVIRKAKLSRRVGLLTNMYPRLLDTIKKYELMPEIEWDIVIDSSIVKFKKPDPRIYELAAKRAGVESNKILLVDNKVDNIEFAGRAGWQTFWYDSRNYKLSSIKLSLLLNQEGV